MRKYARAIIFIFLIIAALAPVSFTQASTPFSVSIWQNMSFYGDGATSSGHSNNTFIAIVGICDEIKDDICISEVETRESNESKWVSLKPKTMNFNEVVCRMCTGQTFGVWRRDERGLPTGHLPARWSGEGLNVIVQPELYGTYKQGKELINPSWTATDTTFKIIGIGITPSSSNLKSMTERDFRVSIKMRDRKDSVTGFFNGRLRDTSLIVNDEGNFIVQGKPVIVSVARTPGWNNANIPDEIIDHFKSMYNKQNWIGIPNPNTWKTTGAPPGWSFGNYTNSDFPNFEFFEKYFDENKTEDVAAWKVTSLNWENFFDINPCFKKAEISGLATTNANMYTDGLPTWDKLNNSLDFRMASPHLTADRKLTSGNYDLVLSESVAKCIWGLETIPTSAMLNISYPDGTSEASTVVIGVRDGFVNFHANGFHFSSPTVKIKMEAPQATPTPVASATPSATPSITTPTPSKSKLITIKCKKGNKTLTKTSAKPVCPSGYKKLAG